MHWNEAPTFRCPECGDTQRAIATEVAHRCPKRENQPISQKGYRRKPMVVQYEKMQAPDLDRNDRAIPHSSGAVAKAQRRRITAQARKSTGETK